MTHLFAAESLSVSYGSYHVLKSASLWADSGRITVLLGRNGSGKTSLLRAALGLVRKDQGEVFLAGRHIDRPRLWSLARMGVYYIPDSSGLSKRMTVSAHFAAHRRQFGNAALDEHLEHLGKDRTLEALPHQLSTGERRFIEVLLALGRRPDCLIADEPLGSVEPIHRKLIMDKLRSLADIGAAVVVTGHDYSDLLELADDVIWLVAGSTQALGSRDDALGNMQFRRQYLGK